MSILLSTLSTCRTSCCENSALESGGLANSVEDPRSLSMLTSEVDDTAWDK